MVAGEEMGWRGREGGGKRVVRMEQTMLSDRWTFLSLSLPVLTRSSLSSSSSSTSSSSLQCWEESLVPRLTDSSLSNRSLWLVATSTLRLATCNRHWNSLKDYAGTEQEYKRWGDEERRGFKKKKGERGSLHTLAFLYIEASGENKSDGRIAILRHVGMTSISWRLDSKQVKVFERLDWR